MCNRLNHIKSWEEIFMTTKRKILKQIILGTAVALSGFGLFSNNTILQTYNPSIVVKADETKETEQGILDFKGKKQLVLGNKDSKGRATAAHIQLQDKDEPTSKREKKLKYNPTGWHNYKFYYEGGEKKAWLMNRGHLIGYQFSGLNDEGRNLVAMTAWLNTGSYKGTNEGNQDSMLFYEQKLDSWLATHPNYWLDYKVTPIYEGDELVPRRIELQYVGVDSKGNLLEITLGGKETKDSNLVSHVTLENTSPNATIDYATGKAENTVKSAAQQEQDRKAEEARQAEEARKAEEERKAAEALAAQQAEEARKAAEAQAAAQAQAEAEAAAQAAAQAQAQAAAQQQSSGGYTRDARGRWHRPNGQYASKAEIAAAGLPW